MAAWWNPFSWVVFNKTESIPVKIETKVQSKGTESIKTKTTTSTSVEKANKAVPVSSPQTKPKTKTSTPLVKLSNAQIIEKIKPATGLYRNR